MEWKMSKHPEEVRKNTQRGEKTKTEKICEIRREIPLTVWRKSAVSFLF